MTDLVEDRPCKATDPKELERQIMSYNEPKNEREWWAMHRIEQLEAEIDRLQKLNHHYAVDKGWEAAKAAYEDAARIAKDCRCIRHPEEDSGCCGPIIADMILKRASSQIKP